jgi:hypothetical protein
MVMSWTYLSRNNRATDAIVALSTLKIIYKTPYNTTSSLKNHIQTVKPFLHHP